MTKCKWTDRCKYCLDKEREEMPISTPHRCKGPQESLKEHKEECICRLVIKYPNGENNQSREMFLKEIKSLLAQKTEEIKKSIRNLKDNGDDWIKRSEVLEIIK